MGPVHHSLKYADWVRIRIVYNNEMGPVIHSL